MFKCEICGRSDFEKIAALTTHIQFHHRGYTSQTYYDKFFKKESEGVCKTCGGPTPFRGILKGYQKFCSNKCVWQDPEVKAKRADSISKLSEEQLKDWRKKQIESSRNSEGYCITEEEAEKRAEISKKSFEEYFSKCDCTFVNYVVHPKRLVTFRCNKCGNETTYVRSLIDRMARTNDYGICHYCNNRKSVSQGERDLREILNGLTDGGIVFNNRHILKGKELDIVLPKYNIAIEFDGVYWHNENVVENDYHLKKTEECEAKGYQLIHIFDVEWRDKKEIVVSRLKGLLGKNQRIYARKTTCKEISYKESKEFIEKSHIQGNCISKWQYGLFDGDKLVAVMTFGKSRFADEFELLRFANALNTNVVGGASKLLKHFVKDHPEISKIVSYADRRWSRGNLYEKIGFRFIHKTDPSYFYRVGRERRSRFEFQKHKLVAQGFDPNKTEHEIMKERKCPRIYDCGTLKYEWTRS
jgi:very-short-patch-repair endonuclease